MNELERLKADIASKPFVVLLFGFGETIDKGHFATADQAHDRLWSEMHKSGLQGQVTRRCLPPTSQR